MSSYAVTISTLPPGITVVAAGPVSYDQFLTSLGFYVYHIEDLQITAQGFSQLNSPMAYEQVPANGVINGEPVVPFAIPWAKVPTIRMNIAGQEILLNGYTSIGYDLLPGEQIQLVAWMQQRSAIADLDKVNKSNFERGGEPLINSNLVDNAIKYPNG